MDRRVNASNNDCKAKAFTQLDELAYGMEELLWPTRCVVCNMPGELLCADCRATLSWIEQRYACPQCGAPHGWLACTDCGADYIRATLRQGVDPRTMAWEPRAVVCALEFEGAGALMATVLKDQHELRLAPVMAAAMATALDEAASWPARDGRPRYDVARTDALCFVPATQKAYARRGFDHMAQVARHLAAELNLPCADVLRRVSGADQRALGKEARADNLRGTITVAGEVAGARFLLADDVITTGASVREATRALLARGAASVTVCALARVW